MRARESGRGPSFSGSKAATLQHWLPHCNKGCHIATGSKAVARIAASHVHLVDRADHLLGERLRRQRERREVLLQLRERRAPDDDGAVRRDEGPRPTPEDRQLGRREPRPLCNRAVRVRRLQRLLPRVAGVPARHVIAKSDEARAAPGRGGRALPVLSGEEPSAEHAPWQQPDVVMARRARLGEGLLEAAREQRVGVLDGRRRWHAELRRHRRPLTHAIRRLVG
mmetsp:Transcript_24553/g.77836  ORF Transcript_24553/g.77836 Transcript_24553/m.77836 type:complete len:224 (+) Transcript_24553:352-1023(+)